MITAYQSMPLRVLMSHERYEALNVTAQSPHALDTTIRLSAFLEESGRVWCGEFGEVPLIPVIAVEIKKSRR